MGESKGACIFCHYNFFAVVDSITSFCLHEFLLRVLHFLHRIAIQEGPFVGVMSSTVSFVGDLNQYFCCP